MGKKGNVKQYFVMFELILVAIIVLGMVLLAKGVAEGKELEKQYLARDIALVMTTIYAAPGDISYTYYLEKKEFDIKISQGQVTISEDGLKPLSYPYAEDTMMQNPDFSAKKPSKITITKKEKKITIEA